MRALFVAGVAASTSVAAANVLLGAALVWWLVELARGRVRWRRASLHAGVAAYLVASLLAVVFSENPARSAGDLPGLATLAVVPMTVTLVDRRWWGRLLVALTGVAVASSAVGLWQYLHGHSDLSNRLRGLASHYMTFSGWVLLVVLLLVGDIFFHRDRRRSWWTVPAAGLCTAALLLSYTRNAWVGLAVGLVLAAGVWRPRAFLLYPVAGVLLWLVLPSPVVDRVVSIFDLTQPANYDRLCMVEGGLEMAENHPLTGVGLQMVKARYPLYRPDDAPRWRVPHLHNNVVQLMAERGLAGLAAYLAILVLGLRHAWRVVRRPDRPEFPAVAGCLLAVAGITAAGLFEYNWGDTEVWIVTLTVLAAPFALVPEERE